MEIVWRTRTNESPYLFRQLASWPGIRVHRARVLPGEMIPQTASTHELNVTLSGRLITEKISSTGKLVTTKGSPGNICLTPYGQTIGARWDEPIDNMGVLIDPALVNTTAVENGFYPNFEFKEIYRQKDPLIQHIGLALLAESASETPAGKLYADSLIQSLTLHLLANYTTAGHSVPPSNGGLPSYKVRRVQEFINENLEDDLGLAELAAVADLSQFHFARAFRKTVGTTPQRYLMQQRIERAKELLADQDLPLIEVGLRTGFKNQSHFTTLFRKITNVTPKVWRELRLA